MSQNSNAITLHFNDVTYPVEQCSASFNNLLEQHLVVPNKPYYFIVVPITKDSRDNPKRIEGTEAHVPHLGLNVLGVVRNTYSLNEVSLNKAHILGIVRYENVRYKFIIIKIWKNSFSETIKVFGTFKEGDRGNSIGKLVEVKALLDEYKLVLDNYRFLDNEEKSYCQESERLKHSSS